MFGPSSSSCARAASLLACFPHRQSSVFATRQVGRQAAATKRIIHSSIYRGLSTVPTLAQVKAPAASAFDRQPTDLQIVSGDPICLEAHHKPPCRQEALECCYSGEGFTTQVSIEVLVRIKTKSEAVTRSSGPPSKGHHSCSGIRPAPPAARARARGVCGRACAACSSPLGCFARGRVGRRAVSKGVESLIRRARLGGSGSAVLCVVCMIRTGMRRVAGGAGCMGETRETRRGVQSRGGWQEGGSNGGGICLL